MPKGYPAEIYLSSKYLRVKGSTSLAAVTGAVSMGGYTLYELYGNGVFRKDLMIFMGIMASRLLAGSIPDFLAGFMMGLGGTAIGVSLVFNLLFIRRLRSERHIG